MSKAKILYVSHKIEPYIEDGQMSKIARFLPQRIQERGKEIRTFMPRFGCINERRYQLHEVIRLSGMNLIIDDTDHPLIIKVASIQAARMQVYFIDNEEYFKRKNVFEDDKGKFHKDNDERMIFFARGVIETVKKLGWAPDIVHCQGWMSSLVPYYLKNVYQDDPVFSNTRVVYSAYDEEFKETMGENFGEKMIIDANREQPVTELNDAGYIELNKFAIDTADAIISGSDSIHADIKKHISKSDKMKLDYQGDEDYADAYSEFYDELLLQEPVLVG